MMDGKDIKFAGFWIRTLAIAIDTVIFLPIYYILSDIVLPDDKATGYWIYLGICTLYFILLETSKYQGSVGKILLSLKVSDVQYKRIGIPQALGRYMLGLISSIPVIWFTFLSYRPEIQALSQNFKQTHVSSPEYNAFMIQFLCAFLFYVIIGLAWYLPVAFTKQKTAVHDLLSKTRVIKVNRKNET